MTKIGERIGILIEEKHISKTEFAKRLNISQAYVSKMIHKKCVPSDRLVEDICEKFHVSEVWLRQGVGEIFAERKQEEEIACFVGRVLREQDNTFQKRYLYMLSCLSREGWSALEQLTEQMLKTEKAPGADIGHGAPAD